MIAYAAKKLSKAEKNYSATKGELFGALYFMSHFKFFLWPAKFVLRTDHHALQWMDTMAYPTGVEQ